MESLIVYIALFFITIIGNIFGTLIGGIGLIVTSSMLIFGVDPLIALGSRRISALGTPIGKIYHFHKEKKIDYSIVWFLLGFAMVGTVLGYVFVNNVNKELIKKIVGVVMLLTVLVIYNDKKEWVKKFKKKGFEYRKIIGPIGAIMAAFIGVTTGGAGGTILAYVLILSYGKTILEASGTIEVVLSIAYLISIVLFIISGNFDIILVLVMFFASIIGAWIGAKFYLSRSEKVVKIFFVIIIGILAIRMIFF